MSETFDAALRDIYAHAAAAPEARLDAALPTMVARTRRTRRVRAAGTIVATAAAVVGTAAAGVALAGTLDGPSAPPAGPTDVPGVVGTRAVPACGMAIADLRVFAEPPATLAVSLDATQVPATGELTGMLEVVGVDDAWGSEIQPSVWGGLEYAAVHDGEIVALPSFDGNGAAFPLTPCETTQRDLAPAEYELWVLIPATIDGQDAYLTSGPVPFTVVADLPSAPVDGHVSRDGASTLPPDDPAAPLPDGDYLALVVAVDEATVEADLVVMYTGQAAQDWLDANDPGAELTNDYVIDDPDGPATRRLPLRTDAPVWEWCSGTEGIEIVQRAGGPGEWAAASPLAVNRQCSDGAAIARSGLYWLYVRDAVVVLVVGQYVP